MPPPSQIRLSFGLYFLLLSSALALACESSTRFHRLAILLVTFFLGGWAAGLPPGLGALRGALAAEEGRGGGTPTVRRLSMSELEGTRRGRAEDSVAERREWEEEEVRMDLTEVAEVRETTEDEEEVEERTGPPRDRDCSRRVWVLVGLGETRGLGVGLGDTVSFRNMLGLEGSLGGVLLEGIEEPLAVLLEEQVEAVSEVSSLVKVPCLTRGAAEVEVRGERGEAVRAPDWARPAGLTALGASFLALACRSCVALVPLTMRGEVWGEEAVRGLLNWGLGATGGGMVARFMGGE